jgi:hypothetical protein
MALLRGELDMFLQHTSADAFLFYDEVLPFVGVILPCVIASIACYILFRKTRSQSKWSTWTFGGACVWASWAFYWLLFLIADLRAMGGQKSFLDWVLERVYRTAYLVLLVLLATWIVVGILIAVKAYIYSKREINY